MTENHPIIPSPELRRLWAQQAQRINSHDPVEWMQHVAARAAQWGADQELEACCEWMKSEGHEYEHEALRAARRPKPLSLKQQAMEAMREMQIKPCIIDGVNTNAGLQAKYDIIRRALEQLDD